MGQFLGIPEALCDIAKFQSVILPNFKSTSSSAIVTSAVEFFV